MCRQEISLEDLSCHHLVNMRVNAVIVCCERKCGWYGRVDARRAHAKVCEIRKAVEFSAVLSSPPPVASKLADPSAGVLSVRPAIELLRGLGLNLETTTGDNLVVGSICDIGPVADHNEAVADFPLRLITAGCDIVEANGIRGDCQELLYVMQKTARRHEPHRLVFKRSTEFCTTVKRNDKEFGLELALRDGGSSFLEILSVIPGGAVMDHNTENAERELKRRDRIVEVNGVRGVGREILQCMRNSDTCQMRIFRLP